MDKEKLNLLFIFTDEQAVRTMGAYGNKQITTPNLDQLASQSIVFENCYVTQPVCTPSRSSIMTGQYPHTNGLITNNISLKQETKCLPEMGFAGYTTGYYGKWHLGDEIFAQHGFTEWKSIEDMYRKHYSPGRDKSQISTYGQFLLNEGFSPFADKEKYPYFPREFCARLPERFSKPAYLAREACEFLENNQENPFILYVNFLEPHMPFFGPRDDQYDPEQIELPPNFYYEHAKDEPENKDKVKLRYSKVNTRPKSIDEYRRLIANYWGLVSLVDTYVGKILNRLQELGLDKNTIVVFTSDHGDMLGSHGLVGKDVMYQEAVKVPLLLKIPDEQYREQRVREPVSQVDLVPTILDLLGQTKPEYLEGYSWVPFLTGDGELEEKDVFIEWNGQSIGPRVRSIVTAEGYRYSWRLRGRDQLYNLKKDPYELNNLADKNQYKDLILSLRNKIIAWAKKTQDQDFLEFVNDI